MAAAIAGRGQADSLADAAGRFPGGSLVGTDSRIDYSFLLLAYFFFLLLDAVLIVWTIVFRRCVVEAHEFSLWKGFLLVLIGIPLIWVCSIRIEYRPHADISRSGI